MKKDINRFIKQLELVADDKTSGATEMLFNTLEILSRAILSNIEISSLKKGLELIVTKQYLFTNLVNIVNKILAIDNNNNVLKMIN